MSAFGNLINSLGLFNLKGRLIFYVVRFESLHMLYLKWNSSSHYARLKKSHTIMGPMPAYHRLKANRPCSRDKPPRHSGVRKTDIKELTMQFSHCNSRTLALTFLTLIRVCAVHADPGKLCQVRIRLLLESQNEQST